MRFPSRLWLAALLVVTGAAHFLVPGFYERIVPRVLAHPRLLVHVSGAAQVASGVLLAVPRTRRVGGWLAAAVLVAVFPANVQMALDGGLEGSDSPLASPAAAWLRLPLQVPLVWWAVREAARRDARPAPAPVTRAG